MSGEQQDTPRGNPPTRRGERRTVVIGEPAADAAPGSGAPIDPLIVPLPEPTRPATRQVTGPTARSGDSNEAAEGSATEAGADDAATGSGPRTVVIGGDDELPDAHYTAASARSPDDPRGPRVHPRLKARRFAVRQDAGRRRALWTVVLGGMLLLGIAAVGILATPLFAISTVRYSGVVYTDQEQLVAITDSLRGKAILTADLEGAKRRIEALPWVRYATVEMDFPHTVVVQIAERTPVVTYLGEDNQWRVIDIDGRVIAVLEGQPVDYLAVLGAGPMLKEGEFAPDYARIAQLAVSFPPALAPMVKVFEIDGQLNVTMTISPNERGDTLVEFCSARNLDVLQIVSLTAFLNTKVNPEEAPPGRINACRPDLITASPT